MLLLQLLMRRDRVGEGPFKDDFAVALEAVGLIGLLSFFKQGGFVALVWEHLHVEVLVLVVPNVFVKGTVVLLEIEISELSSTEVVL